MDTKNIHQEQEDGAPSALRASGVASRPEFDPRTAYVHESGKGREYGYCLTAIDVEGRGLHLLATGMEKHYADYILRAVACHDELVTACELALTAFQPWGTEHPAEAALKAILAKVKAGAASRVEG